MTLFLDRRNTDCGRSPVLESEEGRPRAEYSVSPQTPPGRHSPEKPTALECGTVNSKRFIYLKEIEIQQHGN